MRLGNIEIFSWACYSYFYLMFTYWLSLFVVCFISGPWHLNTVVFLPCIIDKSYLLWRTINLLVKLSNPAISKSVRFVYKRIYCQISVYKPDGLQKILISSLWWTNFRIPSWSPCQEILPVNESGKWLKFSMDLTEFQTREPHKEGSQRSGMSEGEQGRREDLSEESYKLCAHVRWTCEHTSNLADL